ncbi:oxalate--CoA ligase [Trichomonascus vanleenenianus]|uniref:acyl-CoA synthetase n=1 Tax=Trichomonascus vanleenenianus TaxID=2268995 RepID=UPI003ECACC7A
MLRAVGRQARRCYSTNHPILSRLNAHPKDKTAIRHVESGNEYSYGQLVEEIGRWRSVIKEARTSKTIAIMGENSFQFVAPFYAALSVEDTVAMPLCTNHTEAEIGYQLENSGARQIITPKRFLSKLEPFKGIAEIITTEEASSHNGSDVGDVSSNTGYMLYTSGTSGKPKGVVTPLETFVAQAKALTEAWNINSETNFLQTLPLHHVHGLLIATTLPLLAGGRTEFLFPFSPSAWAQRIADEKLPPINTYTAVPTIYTRLSRYIQELPAEERQRVQNAIAKNLKLAMCGSAALPTPLRDAWDAVSLGQVPLLERYGMTETGITFSQPLDASKRVPGSVGRPVPSVIARLVDAETGNVVYTTEQNNTVSGKKSAPGEIQLTGPVVFKEYLNRPDATKETFSSDGWFKTGDVAFADEGGQFHILGRASMDIIKSGGEKLSALEIEREILSLPQVAECSVIGLPDREWGEKVTAIVVLLPEAKLTLEELKASLRNTLAGWKIPKRLEVVAKIPRNQMGKVNKKQLVKQYSE